MKKNWGCGRRKWGADEEKLLERVREDVLGVLFVGACWRMQRTQTQADHLDSPEPPLCSTLTLIGPLCALCVGCAWSVGLGDLSDMRLEGLSGELEPEREAHPVLPHLHGYARTNVPYYIFIIQTHLRSIYRHLLT